MIEGLVVVRSRARSPIVNNNDLVIPLTKSEPDKTAKATLVRSRRKTTVPPSLPRVHLRIPKVQEAPAPVARRESSTAIENARRLAERLRKRQANSQLAGNQRALVEEQRGGAALRQRQGDQANDGPTTHKTIEPEDILRRAFIAKW